MVLKFARDAAMLLDRSVKDGTCAGLVSNVGQNKSIDFDLSINSEVFNTINFTVFGLLKLLLHPLEVGLLGLLADFYLINLTDRHVKNASEVIEALYVCLDHVELIQTLILRKDGVLILGSRACRV